jgi:hypothetical protein
MECGEREEDGLDGDTLDDDALQCLFALDDSDEWLCPNTMSPLSRQFSNSSQNSFSRAFPDEFAEARERSHVEKRSCSENVGIVHDFTIYPERSMLEALSFLPTPLQLKTDWSIYDFISSNTRESLCTPIIIPQPSREILMEGVPSKEKRPKIARYLEKRRRRIEKIQMEKNIPSYPARSNVASSRVRRGGRFVCSSEWGKRPNPYPANTKPTLKHNPNPKSDHHEIIDVLSNV